MKKIKFISFLFLTLFMCMCCEPDPIVPDYPANITTEADLDGYWEFVSLSVPATGIITECDELVGYMTLWYGKVLRSYEFTYSTLKVDVTDKCATEPLYPNRTYSVSGLDIVISGAHFPFTYNNITGELMLQIPPPDGGAGYLTITLQKI